jgi:hypothetical protein
MSRIFVITGRTETIAMNPVTINEMKMTDTRALISDSLKVVVPRFEKKADPRITAITNETSSLE